MSYILESSFAAPVLKLKQLPFLLIILFFISSMDYQLIRLQRTIDKDKITKIKQFQMNHMREKQSTLKIALSTLCKKSIYSQKYLKSLLEISCFAQIELIIRKLNMVWGWPFNKKGSDQSSQQNSHDQQPQFQTRSYFRSYSTSKSCRSDPEDEGYMICKETTNDGNNTYEKEQRIPKYNPNDGGNSKKYSENTSISGNFNGFNNGFLNDDFFKEFDRNFGALPLFGSLLFPNQFFNQDMHQYHQDPNQNRNQQYQNNTRTNQNYSKSKQPQNYSNDKNYSNKYYFSQRNQRDFDVKDL